MSSLSAMEVSQDPAAKSFRMTETLPFQAAKWIKDIRPYGTKHVIFLYELGKYKSLKSQYQLFRIHDVAFCFYRDASFINIILAVNFFKDCHVQNIEQFTN
ncbi:hypothetical protein AVEN_188167-1 [Araneus ventricosus]|uniref:Uncharacterized protein n=1 Tax=Araneus ventricosus TaxID=182803 RepID=A0A4Y2IAT0_ARAVE|nr:hypothetical protein AVEN_188167-1 [Araneus ventricosus]